MLIFNQFLLLHSHFKFLLFSFIIFLTLYHFFIILIFYSEIFANFFLGTEGCLVVLFQNLLLCQNRFILSLFKFQSYSAPIFTMQGQKQRWSWKLDFGGISAFSWLTWDNEVLRFFKLEITFILARKPVLERGIYCKVCLLIRPAIHVLNSEIKWRLMHAKSDSELHPLVFTNCSSDWLVFN